MASPFIVSLSSPNRGGFDTVSAAKSWMLSVWRESLVLSLSGLVTLWGLENNGWGNPYYAAAAQAGAANWESLLFGSADAGNGLTIDKPPLHIWILAASVKLLGLSPMSVLLPQALMGMAAALLVFKIVALLGSPRQATIAALFFIVTPVFAIIFRFNNPDSLMILLWSLATLLLLKYGQSGSAGPLRLAGLALGFAFLCKQFQAWIIVPPIILAVMLFGAGQLWVRARWLCGAAVCMILPPAVWIAVAELTPSSDRPWIGGTSTNSFLELTCGYNGLGRLTGNADYGAINPKDYEGLVGYDAGVFRLLTINYAAEVIWLLPLAAVGTAGLVWGLGRRTKRQVLRPQLAVAQSFFAAFFITVFGVLSFMTGDIHPYYTSMLLIPTAVAASHAVETFWLRRYSVWHRRAAALTLMATALVSVGVLTWYQNWMPWAGEVVKILSFVAVGALCFWIGRHRPRLCAIGFAAAAPALLLLPVLFSLESVLAPQQGSFPMSGPVPTVESWHRRDAEQLRLNEQANYSMARGEPVVDEIAEQLENAPRAFRWTAATTGSQNAALYQLATGRSVMSIGGFSTGDVYPAISDFKQAVARGEVAYYIHQPGILEWANSSSNTRAVVSWIESTFNYELIRGVRVYRLGDFPR